MLTLLETIAWLLLLFTCLCWGCTIITNLFRSVAKAPRWWTRAMSIIWPLMVLLGLFVFSAYHYWNPSFEEGGIQFNNIITPHDAFWPFLAIIPAYLVLCLGFHVHDLRRWKLVPDRIPWRLGRRWAFAAFVPQCCLLALLGMMLLIQWQARVNQQKRIDYWDAEYRSAFGDRADPEAQKTLELYLELYPRFDYVAVEDAQAGDLVYPFDYTTYFFDYWNEHSEKPLSEFEDFPKMIKFYASIQKEIEALDRITRRSGIAVEVPEDLNDTNHPFQFRIFSSLVYDDAQVALYEADYDRAFRNALILKRISLHQFIRNDTFSPLVSFALYSNAINLIKRLLIFDTLTDDQWQQWWNIPYPDHFPDPQLHGMMHLSLSLRSINHELDGPLTSVGEQVSFLPENLWEELPFALFMLDRHMAYANANPDYLNRAFVTHGLPTFTVPKNRGRVIVLSEEKLDQISDPGLLWFSLYNITIRSLARRLNETEALRVIQAAQLYSREQGQYPENLEALIPKYLETLPMDRFRLPQLMEYSLLEDGSLRLVILHEEYLEAMQEYEDGSIDDKALRRRLAWMTMTIPPLDAKDQ